MPQHQTPPSASRPHVNLRPVASARKSQRAVTPPLSPISSKRKRPHAATTITIASTTRTRPSSHGPSREDEIEIRATSRPQLRRLHDQTFDDKRVAVVVRIAGEVQLRG